MTAPQDPEEPPVTGAPLREEARALLLSLLQEEREAIVNAGTDWIIRRSPDLQGRRPRDETVMLVQREFDAYRDLIVDGDPSRRDSFIEFTTTFRASSEFRISTLLRGFLCFKRGVEAVMQARSLSAELSLEIVGTLDELYFETSSRMVDVYADKLLAVLESTQAQLMQREKMAALGGLVAGVAHEINTPMGVAVTAASLLHDSVVALGRDFDGGQLRKSSLATFLRDAREAADLTLGNLRRASELVTSFKKIAVDQSHTTRRKVSLGPYLREVVSSLGPLYKRGPHRLDLVIDDSLTAELDPGVLSQILTNLVQNALVHAFADDSPGVMLLLLQRHGDDGAELAFSDDGRGLSEVEKRRLFEPFFTTRRGAGGSGLGMHIVHSLVTQSLHGRITVDSTLGEGTTLRICFPLRAQITGAAPI